MRIDKRRMKLIYKYIAKKAPVGKKVRILDIGYAQYLNPHLLKNPDFDVTGIDLSPNPSDRHYHKEVIGDATKDLGYLGTFDFIIAGEFIEHLENPYQFLRNLHGIAGEDTVVLLSTPNPLGIPIIFFEYLWTKKFVYHWEHKYLFLPRWMERIIRRTGWEPVKTIGVGADLGLVHFPVPKIFSYVLIYALKQAKNTQAT
jgi:2-polyprenyl-3-methyl-5-hydroxy-6-metoxy-1,4-benzoquinol methylase